MSVRLGHALYEPPGEGPHPTLIALHGFRSSAFELLELAPYVLGGRALFLAPEGRLEVEPETPGAARAHGWFPLTLARPPTAADVMAAIADAREFVDWAVQRYPIDPERVAVLGFSQGGVVAYGLALAEPARFRALVALSSWLPDHLDAAIGDVDASGLHCWVVHGTRDPTVAVQRGRDSAKKLERRRAALTYREYDMGHEISAQSREDLVTWLDERLS